MRNSENGEKYQPTAKHLLNFSTKKIFLDTFTSSAIKSVIPSPSNNNFHLMTPYKLHLQLQSLLLYHFFYVHVLYTHVACSFSLLNVVFSMTKALKYQSFPSNISIICYWKTLLPLMLIFLFFIPTFYFKLYKTSTDTTLVGTLSFVC